MGVMDQCPGCSWCDQREECSGEPSSDSTTQSVKASTINGTETHGTRAVQTEMKASSAEHKERRNTTDTTSEFHVVDDSASEVLERNHFSSERRQAIQPQDRLSLRPRKKFGSFNESRYWIPHEHELSRARVLVVGAGIAFVTVVTLILDRGRSCRSAMPCCDPSSTRGLSD